MTSETAALAAGGAAAADEGVSSSPNNGDNELQMQSFVQEHLLSLLRPMSDYIRDLQKQVNGLQSDFLNHVTRTDKNFARLDPYDAKLASIGSELHAIAERVGKVNVDSLRMLDAFKKESRDRAQSIEQRFEEHVAKCVPRFEALERSSAECVGSLAQLQEACRKTDDSLCRVIDGDIVDLRKSCAWLEHCHLGLSSRLEQAKQVGDDTSAALQKLSPSLAHLTEETKQNFERSKRRQHAIENELASRRTEIASQADSISNVQAAVDILERNLHRVTALENKMTEQADQLAKEGEGRDNAVAESKSFLEVMQDRLNSCVAHVNSIEKHMNERVASEIATLFKSVDANTTEIKSGILPSVQRLDDGMSMLRDSLSQSEQRIAAGEAEAGRLAQRADVAEDRVKSLEQFREEANGRMTKQDAEVERAWLRLQCHDQVLEDLKGNIQELSVDHGSTKEMVSSIAARLDIAHEYLHGMTRGIQDVHRQAAENVDMMPPPSRERKQQTPAALPELPGARLRRPVTALA